MKTLLPLVLVLVAALSASEPRPPEPITWETPSEDARGSMPLGNGDIALNAWVEPGGDLLFYLGKSDSWEDNARLAKVGLVRVRCQPALLPMAPGFRQELDAARGEMTVSAQVAALGVRPAAPARLRVWVDANHPVAHVTVDSEVPLQATASLEPWRAEPHTVVTKDAADVMWDHTAKEPARITVEPDAVLRDLPDGIGWYHHNRRSLGPVETMRFQDLLGAPWRDPVLHRTFGAVIAAPGARRVDDTHLALAAASQQRIDVHVLTRQPASPEEWLQAMRAQMAAVNRIPFTEREAAHRDWWRQFWTRSHIVITPRSGAADPDAAADVTRGYAWQRYITACASRGEYPVRFNGSLFTVPWPDQPANADYRRWGSGYWWQNTRLPYASLCTSGDFDLLLPFHRLYAGELMAVSRYRAQRHFGFADAAYLPECVYSWGAVFSDTYGWEQPAAERTDKLQSSRWHKWEWVGGLELASMLCDYFDHTGDEDFARTKLLPTALPLVRFFAHYYRTGPDGRLIMHPAQALETWWEATNPMPEIAGLHAVVGRLLKLPPAVLPAADRAWLEAFQRTIPPLPVREADGVRMLAAAENFDRRQNVENPELYAVFPFRLASFEKPNAPLAVEALHRRLERGAFGWRHEDIFMAYLGLTDEARDYVVQRARDAGNDRIGAGRAFAMRFPAFWGPNYDWVPDQCHGGVLMKAVQAMLLQSEPPRAGEFAADGDPIYLLPAWPKDWNVDFKLHAPRQTVIEGVVRDGKLVSLKVTPESRRADVVVAPAFK